MASFSPETDCMIAETKGTLTESGLSSPFLKRQSGVFKTVRSGVHRAEEYEGTKRYSPKV